MAEITRSFHAALKNLFGVKDRDGSPVDLRIRAGVSLSHDMLQNGWALAEPVSVLDDLVDHSAGAATVVLVSEEESRAYHYRLVSLSVDYSAGTTNCNVTVIHKPHDGTVNHQLAVQTMAPGDVILPYETDPAANSFHRLMGWVVPPNATLKVQMGNGGAGATTTNIRAQLWRVPVGCAVPK